MADLVGSTGNDLLTGGTAADSIEGGSGNDTLDGGAGRDNLQGEAGNDSLVGGDGADTIIGGDGDDTLKGGDFGDFISGGAGNDFLQGNKGNDTLNGNEGDDTLIGGQGSDVLRGGKGNDVIIASKNGDFINGNLGNDNVVGGIGNDTIHGGQGDDTVTGGAGDDMIIGDKGNDVLIGGEGNDIFVINNEAGTSNTIADFSAGETINISAAGGTFEELTITDSADGAVIDIGNGQTITVAGMVATDIGETVISFDTNLDLTATQVIAAQDDDTKTVVVAEATPLAFVLQAGADGFTGAAKVDTFTFESANFTSSDTLDGGEGVDILRASNAATVIDADFTNVTSIESFTFLADSNKHNLTLGTLSQTAGIVTVNTEVLTGGNFIAIDLSARTDTVNIVGGAGSERVTAGSGVENMSLGAENDTVYIAAADFTSDDTIDGGTGNDVIEFTSVATIVDADFTNVTSVEILTIGDYGDDGPQSVTLGALSQAAGVSTVDAGGVESGLTVDLSARTDTVTVKGAAFADSITAGSGDESILGGGGSDVITFSSANFTSADTIDGDGGKSSGGGSIVISDAATVVAADFDNVTNIDTLVLGDFDAQSVILSAGDTATVDVSAMTGSNTADITLAAGNDTVKVAFGGSGVVTINSFSTGRDVFDFTGANDAINVGFETEGPELGNITLTQGLTFLNIDNATSLSTTDVAAVFADHNGGGSDVVLNKASDTIYVLVDDGTDTGLFFVDDVGDDDTVIDAVDLTLIATFDGVGSVGDFESSNFVDFAELG